MRSENFVYASARGPRVLLDISHPVLDRLGRQIVVKPLHVAAIVFDAVATSHAMRLGDIDSAALVEAKRHRVGQERLGGDQLQYEPCRGLHSTNHSLRVLIGGHRGDRPLASGDRGHREQRYCNESDATSAG